jgi:carbonic anhydrase
MWQQTAPSQYQTTTKPKQDPYAKWGAIATWILLLFVVIGFPLAVLVYVKLHPMEEEVPPWNYGMGKSGPSDWGSIDAACNGNEQSPINLSPTANQYLGKTSTISTSRLSEFASPYQLGTYTVTQGQGGPKFTCRGSNCGTLKVDGQDYTLKYFEFHAPSENTVDGHAFPLSMNMVHQDTATKKVAVVTVLFESTISEGVVNVGTAAAVIDKIWTKISADGSATMPIDLTTMVSATSGFYRYKGSLTAPPCAEGVDWFVQALPVAVKASQVKSFWNHIGGYPGNARPIQPLGGRTVTYNVDRT